MKTRHQRLSIAVLIMGAIALAGCGSSTKSSSSPSPAQARTTSTTTASQSTAAPPPAVDELAAAEHPAAAQFPPAKGRTLQQLASTVALERPARGRHGHVHARDRPVRLCSEHQLRRVHLRAHGGVPGAQPEQPGAGAVPRSGRPDDRRATVPQQAGLGTGRDPGDLRGRGAAPAPGHLHRPVADPHPDRADRRARGDRRRTLLADTRGRPAPARRSPPTRPPRSVATPRC